MNGQYIEKQPGTLRIYNLLNLHEKGLEEFHTILAKYDRKIQLMVHGFRQPLRDIIGKENSAAADNRIAAVQTRILKDGRPTIILDDPMIKDDIIVPLMMKGLHGPLFFLDAPIDGSPDLSVNPQENRAKWNQVKDLFVQNGVKDITVGGQGWPAERSCITVVRDNLSGTVPWKITIDPSMTSLY